MCSEATGWTNEQKEALTELRVNVIVWRAVAIDSIPPSIRERYHIEETRHACAILSVDCPGEMADILGCLEGFILLRSEISEGGGGKSKIARRFDDFLAQRGWAERSIRVSRTVNDRTVETETHKVDFYKGRVAVEVEWNNKDPFFSRDLNAFRLLHELDAISVGVIITRADELQAIFDALPPVWDQKWRREVRIGGKYGNSTTHWSKLMPRVNGGEAGACPLLLVGITASCYADDLAQPSEAQPL